MKENGKKIFLQDVSLNRDTMARSASSCCCVEHSIKSGPFSSSRVAHKIFLPSPSCVAQAAQHKQGRRAAEPLACVLAYTLGRGAAWGWLGAHQGLQRPGAAEQWPTATAVRGSSGGTSQGQDSAEEHLKKLPGST